jgi:hypothetical protein
MSRPSQAPKGMTTAFGRSAMKKRATALLAAIGLIVISAANSLADTEPAQSEAIETLVDEFNRWIEVHTSLDAKPASSARIQFVEPGERVIADGEEHLVRSKNRGLYDADKAIIYLVRPWDVRDPFDQSVLLHELIHHAQVGARYWSCPQAMEWDAYKWQEQWLAKHDIAPDFNWTAILLESSCSRHDHHPD